MTAAHEASKQLRTVTPMRLASEVKAAPTSESMRRRLALETVS